MTILPRPQCVSIYLLLNSLTQPIAHPCRWAMGCLLWLLLGKLITEPDRIMLWCLPYLCFYPRPVMAFRYCRCLRLSVCVCVCVCVSVNHQFVRTITCHPLKLQSPNLDQKCKRPWLRSLLFLGFIDLDLQGQIELKSQNLPHFGLESLSGQ